MALRAEALRFSACLPEKYLWCFSGCTALRRTPRSLTLTLFGGSSSRLVPRNKNNDQKGRYFYLAGMEGFDPRSAGPRFRQSKRKLACDVALQTATGSSHPEYPTRVLESLSSNIKIPQTQGLRYFYGWDGGIRTPECQDQNLVPYHLATSHLIIT